jgi:hypothetical protein
MRSLRYHFRVDDVNFKLLIATICVRILLVTSLPRTNTELHHE